ncbi:MAG: BMP family ABC transporter substrate-binding protein [Cellulosilyticaceae bacterium]
MNQFELEGVYEQAIKSAKQAWNALVNKGEIGNLPSLDGIVQQTDVASEVPLGLVEVPLNKIIGTYTHSRSVAFAHNFMPLMGAQTEFATKWMHLYQAHIEEGIREPLKVYEYLNRFFVVEGNKRVSVLKFVGATSFNAYVMRLVPKRDAQSKVNTIYYEFMDFYKKTQLNTIWFTQEGRFEELYKFIQNYSVINAMLETKEKTFISNVYRPFRTIYLREGGQRLPITTGDAFLNFLKIYGLPDEVTENAHKKYIVKLIEELQVIEKEEVNVKTDTLETPRKKRVFSTLSELMSPKKTLRIAFVYAKAPERSGWAYSHELGRLHIDNIFKGQIQTTKIIDVPESPEAYGVLEKLAKEKYDIVFTTSPTFVAPALKAAMQYPATKFFNCAATHSYKSLTLYFGRIHEPRFLLGMIAGAMTKTNTIGYIAPYPISEVVSSINAFTLGARAVNPYVKVKAMWTYRWDNPEQGKDVARKMKEINVDIISNEDLPIPQDMSKEYGIYSIGENELDKKHYAMAIWNWGVFYEKVIRNILSGVWKTVTDISANEEAPLNFWLGMNTGIVDVLYSNRQINPQMKYLIEGVKSAITRNEFNVFTGPIYDQNNKLRVKTGEVCDYEDIIHMDWLVDGVEGELPNNADLKPTDPFSYMKNIVHTKQ